MLRCVAGWYGCHIAEICDERCRRCGAITVVRSGRLSLVPVVPVLYLHYVSWSVVGSSEILKPFRTFQFNYHSRTKYQIHLAVNTGNLDTHEEASL